jgi:hypothetical protein
MMHTERRMAKKDITAFVLAKELTVASPRSATE